MGAEVCEGRPARDATAGRCPLPSAAAAPAAASREDEESRGMDKAAQRKIAASATREQPAAQRRPSVASADKEEAKSMGLLRLRRPGQKQQCGRASLRSGRKPHRRRPRTKKSEEGQRFVSRRAPAAPIIFKGSIPRRTVGRSGRTTQRRRRHFLSIRTQCNHIIPNQHILHELYTI